MRHKAGRVMLNASLCCMYEGLRKQLMDTTRRSDVCLEQRSPMDSSP